MEKLIEETVDGKTIWKCPCCGEIYEEIPLCFGYDEPDYYWSVPENEREKRVELKESLCVIDRHFFHRGRLQIPIVDYHEDLIINVWTTISEDNFRKRNELWRKAKRIQEPPYFGWLQSVIPTYENTINIKTIAKEQKVGYIPIIEVVEENHPLTVAQQDGITLEKAREIVGVILINTHK